ncbi:MAG: SMP-30/gluconolactonase/LRE family protein [Cyclobacteriaceae bacterium]
MINNKVLSFMLLCLAGALYSCSTNSEKKNAEDQVEVYKGIKAEGAELKILSSDFKFTEGPAVNSNGDIFFTDQPNNKIVKWSASTGEFTTFLEPSGRANGTYFDANGNLIACADMENQLWSIDQNGNVIVLVSDYDGMLLNGPNDVWINPKDGSMYITDPLYKRGYWTRDPEQQQDGRHLYYLSPDRSKFMRVDENLKQPNGVVGTPDGKNLYVADPGDKKTYVYDIETDGSLTNRKLFAGIGSDGMTVDNEGNVYLTNGGVVIFNKDGEQIEEIPTEEGTTNVAFGGSDRQTLFITAHKSVYTLETRVKGVVN